MTLGQPDNGHSPRTPRLGAPTTSSRRASAGNNGPLLVSVRLEPPAKPDTKKLNQVEAEQQSKRTRRRSSIRSGRSRRRPRASPRRPSRRVPTAKQKQQQPSRSSSSSRPRATRGWSSSATGIGKDPDVDDVSLPAVNQAGTAGCSRHLAVLAGVRADGRPRRSPARHDDSRRARSPARRRRSSADRPLPTSISPTRSPSSCRS